MERGAGPWGVLTASLRSASPPRALPQNNYQLLFRSESTAVSRIRISRLHASNELTEPSRVVCTQCRREGVSLRRSFYGVQWCLMGRGVSEGKQGWTPGEKLVYWESKSSRNQRSKVMAWLRRNSKEKNAMEKEERARMLFEKIIAEERVRLNELEELKKKAKLQADLESVQATEWDKFLLKLQGKGKGSYWNPEPAPNIPFSEFWRLLQNRKLQYMEYGNLGQDVAVILPYYRDEMSTTRKGNEKIEDSDRGIVFRRHMVEKMPADGWTDIWKRLHKQLIHVEVNSSSTFPSQTYPTLALAVVWIMRLVLALYVFRWLDSKLYPVYKLRDPNARPNIRRPKISSFDSADLGSLGQSRARFISAEESTGVTFDDFAGQEYVKRELQEVVKILKDTGDFESLGIYCPKGVLLYGPPGTGKTLLAKAIAGEAGVPFFSASGSEFVEMFVGVAAARVRDLFTRARQFSPSIVFIDEIDAIGAKRGGPDVGGGGVEREQGLIQILTELDGFQTSNAKVLVVGATNRLDMLDPALLRKGRFDKVINVGLPTEEGRLAILGVHARNKGWRSEAEKEQLLKEIASLALDFSGAELQNVLNEASILAARKDKDIIERTELLEALRRQEGYFKTGEEDEIDVTGEARMRVAYREAAIAVLECYFPNRPRPFLKTTVRYLDTTPNMDYAEPRTVVFAKKADIVNSIIRTCAPRIVEEQIFGEGNVSWISGASLEQAGVQADYLILQTGMTALGKINYESHQDVMLHLGPKIQALRDEYIRYAVEKCAAVLKEYRSALETIAGVLLEKLDIDAAEIWEIFRKAPRVPQPEPFPVDEYAALVHCGRWGIHGISLPGRLTFRPGNVGFATYGAPRPQQTRFFHEDTWKMIDSLRKQRITELKKDSEQKEEIPDVVLGEHFL